MGAAPKAVVEITASSTSLGARLAEARAKWSKFGGELKRNVFGKDLVEKGFWGKAGASLVGNLGASAVQAAGGFLVDQGREVLAFNDSLKRLEITAGKTPEFMAAFAASVRRTSSDVGIGAKSILDGASAYVALTGDMDGASASARTWGRVAQATNSTVADISQTAAALKQQLDIRPEQMEASFAALAAQGKAGAIELKDLAGQLSSIAPQWAEFGRGKGVQGVKELGATLQIVKRGFGGDASETVTGLQSLLNAYVKNAARLEKGGVKIFEKDPTTGVKHLRNVLDITNQLAESKLAKDPTKLEKALGRVEAYRAYLQIKANREELDKLVDTAGDVGIIGRDLDKYLNSPAGRASKAWEKAKNDIAEAFTPERIESFTTALVAATKVASTFAGVLGTIASYTEKAAKGFAAMSGFQPEEERAAEMQAKQLDARYIAAEGILKKNGDADGLTPEELREKAVQLVGQEDAYLRTVASHQRIGGPTRTREVPREITTGAGGPTFQATDTVVGRSDYSIAELEALGKYFDAHSGDMTNSSQFQKVISDLVVQQQKAQEQFLQKFAEKPIIVQVMPDSILSAGRSAPQNARRPGE